MLHVHLFGGLSIAWDKISLPVIRGAVARSLFSYLVTHRDRPHTCDLLAGTFWPDMPDVSARRRLSQALWQIRRALDPHPVLATEGSTVQFNPALPHWLDIEEFTKHSAECASANFEQVLHLFQEVGDRQSEGLALANLGDVADYRGDYETARDRYMESLLIFRAVGDQQTEGWTLGNLGNACASLADYWKARAYHEEALDALRQVGDRRGEGFVLANLGLLVHHANEQQLAAEYCQQALEITQEIGDRLNQGYAYTNLGHALVSLDRLDDAATAYQQALALRREFGQDNLAVEPLAGLARVGRLQGNLAQALTHTEQILEYLELNPGLDGTDEPLRVYLSCYHILHDSLDPRARGLLIGAQNLLQELAAKIDDKELRRSFLEHATTQREIVAAYRELGTGPQKDQLALRLPRRGVPTGRPVLEDEYVSATLTADSPEDKSIANKVARRQYRLARLLRDAEEQDAAPTVDDLADALEVSPGTVKRDLSALRLAGHEVQTRGSRGG